MSSPNPVGVFGKIVPASMVEANVTATLKKWFPRYLHEVERQLGWPTGSIRVPTNYSNRNSFDLQAGDKLPKIVVISPGLASAPIKYNARQHKARYNVGVGIACAARTEDEASELSKIYGATVHAILLQKQSLGGFANDITWINETFDDTGITFQNQRLRAAAEYFTVEVEDVVSKLPGPSSPDDNSYEYGLVDTVDINIIKEAIQ